MKLLGGEQISSLKLLVQRPKIRSAMCSLLHKSVRALGDTGSNIQLLHYLLTNQQAGQFTFFVRV